MLLENSRFDHLQTWWALGPTIFLWSFLDIRLLHLILESSLAKDRGVWKNAIMGIRRFMKMKNKVNILGVVYSLVLVFFVLSGWSFSQHLFATMFGKDAHFPRYFTLCKSTTIVLYLVAATICLVRNNRFCLHSLICHISLVSLSVLFCQTVGFLSWVFPIEQSCQCGVILRVRDEKHSASQFEFETGTLATSQYVKHMEILKKRNKLLLDNVNEKNTAANELFSLPELPDGVVGDLARMFASADEDEVWRDYCLQFLGSALEREDGVTDEDRALARETLVEALASTNATFAGTALRALHRGDSSDSLVASNALRIARNSSYPSSSRTTALLILEDCVRATFSTASTASTLTETASAISADPAASSLLRQTAEAVLKRLPTPVPGE